MLHTPQDKTYLGYTVKWLQNKKGRNKKAEAQLTEQELYWKKELAKLEESMMKAGHGKCPLDWDKPLELVEFHTQSEVIGQNHTIKMSKKYGPAICIQWQIGDGMRDLGIQGWQYYNGVFSNHHMLLKEGVLMDREPLTRPTIDPKLGAIKGSAKEFPELPDCLNRKLNGIKSRAAPDLPKGSSKPISNPKTVTYQNDLKENGLMTNTQAAVATKATTKAPVKVSAKAKKPVKATAKKAAKPAAAKKAAPEKKKEVFVGKAPRLGAAKIIEAFELREGSNREKLVTALVKNAGKPMTIDALLKATYGKASEENRGALNMVIGGARNTIVKNKMDLQIVAHANDKGERCVGLYAK